MHNSLTAYYQQNFAIHYHYKTDLAFLDQMIPFEREIYLIMLQEQLKKEEEDRRKNG